MIDTVQRALNLDASLSGYVQEALEYRARSGALSTRERQVLSFVEVGRSTREISETLGLSVRTVENHKARIFQKMGVSRHAELVRKAASLDVLRAHGTII